MKHAYVKLAPTTYDLTFQLVVLSFACRHYKLVIILMGWLDISLFEVPKSSTKLYNALFIYLLFHRPRASIYRYLYLHTLAGTCLQMHEL